ncbi:MAG: phosphoribosylamine--glycine ligase [Clostridiales bacterium]|nr:phosphoribosylamine--glycine ligase [Clostridiales bacterium]
MKILVVGGGGREHAIIWKLSQNKSITKIYCAPGNGGIAHLAECVDIKVTDVEGIVDFAVSKGIDLAVVAQDDPLSLGMVDALEAKSIRAFGPRKLAAEIESSKAFSKALMKKYGIPTAEFEVFNDFEAAKEYITKKGAPIVVKADGLALGKGVIVAATVEEAIDALKSIMLDKQFGTAGARVVIEECLTGPEVSVLAFTDSKTIVPMVSAQDHKRALDNDQGKNTGGMGAFSPSRYYTDDIAKTVYDTIILPTMNAMNAEGRNFKGVLYFGLMLTPNGPKVIEYNCRFGDPEAQAVLPRLNNDLLEIMEAIIDERLSDLSISWKKEACACVVEASGGYPDAYVKGKEIYGLDKVPEDIIVFHAGTALKDGKHYTNGGRVLGITAFGETVSDATKRAYEYVGVVGFDNMHYRNDIGKK